MSKKYLISFASPDLKRSADRYYKQAKSLNFYDEIFVFSLSDLEKESQEKIQKLLKDNKRNGYGYWFWKPLIFKQLLKKIHERDIIHYTDVGCHLNLSGLKRLNYYIKKLQNTEQGFLAFQYNPLKDYNYKDFEFPNIAEYIYTKADLFDYFNVLKEKEITNTNQFWAGNILLKKNRFTENFINRWIDIFDKRFDLVDDTPSKIPNFKNFLHNKHDQSVYSLLCKLHKVESLSAYECDWFYHKGRRYWKHTEKSPVIARRDKKYNIFQRFLNRQKKTIKRYYNKLLSE